MARSPQSNARTLRPESTANTLDRPVERQDETAAVDQKRRRPEAASDADATVMRGAVRPAATPEPRRNTLATAMPRQSAATRPMPAPMPAPTPEPQSSQRVQAARVTAKITAPIDTSRQAFAVEDEVSDEVDGWSAADQPTVYLPPRSFLTQRPLRMQADTRAPQPQPQRSAPPQPAVLKSWSRDVPGEAAPPLDAPFALGQHRLASPDGRYAADTPPPGIPRAALASPRMERFQELRERRMSLDPEQREAPGGRQVAETVRQWWGDLLPGVERALRHQRDAQASGVHPLSPHAESPAAWLGDAFGRISNSARALTQRTQAVVAPTLKRLHDQAEQKAQALVERIEGSATRQQAPLLGPGRIAVFFEQGVTVSRAQALLSSYQARPIRLIPRKQGFLAVVRPGYEAETAEHLRTNQLVRDVAYLEFDEYGEPIEPR